MSVPSSLSHSRSVISASGCRQNGSLSIHRPHRRDPQLTSSTMPRRATPRSTLRTPTRESNIRQSPSMTRTSAAAALPAIKISSGSPTVRQAQPAGSRRIVNPTTTVPTRSTVTTGSTDGPVLPTNRHRFPNRTRRNPRRWPSRQDPRRGSLDIPPSSQPRRRFALRPLDAEHQTGTTLSPSTRPTDGPKPRHTPDSDVGERPITTDAATASPSGAMSDIGAGVGVDAGRVGCRDVRVGLIGGPTGG